MFVICYTEYGDSCDGYPRVLDTGFVDSFEKAMSLAREFANYYLSMLNETYELIEDASSGKIRVTSKVDNSPYALFIKVESILNVDYTEENV